MMCAPILSNNNEITCNSIFAFLLSYDTIILIFIRLHIICIKRNGRFSNLSVYHCCRGLLVKQILKTPNCLQTRPVVEFFIIGERFIVITRQLQSAEVVFC
jgi:hypothetical protein